MIHRRCCRPLACSSSRSRSRSHYGLCTQCPLGGAWCACDGRYDGGGRERLSVLVSALVSVLVSVPVSVVVVPVVSSVVVSVPVSVLVSVPVSSPQARWNNSSDSMSHRH